MRMILSNLSKEPIYEQIKRQIKEQIMSGDLTEGELLPSIRSLAKELQVSVITTKRAYDDLEKEGFVATMPGKGSYVLGQNMELLKEHRMREIEEEFTQTLHKAYQIGLSEEQVIEIIHILSNTR